ncbi:MAG TPA: class I SAM-dependent methyltransferase [Candidatus Kapabacteria bacterium]|nr:class I SAM-dependent methyltransferase [Candidatus Kapabacteria bacterium]
MKKYDLEQIRNYWEAQVKKHKQSPGASWSDTMVIEMEINAILEYLVDGDLVLDAGCANGYSTIRFAIKRNINILGIDYIPEMIVQAHENLKQCKKEITGTIAFETGNVMSIAKNANFYNKVIIKRVIASLGDYDNQLYGIRECSRVLKPGGLLLLSDATLLGWEKLNAFRREWQLPEISMPEFNNYLDQEKLLEDLSPELELCESKNFASTYYVGTRILKPLLIRALDLDIDASVPNMEWNRWFSLLPSWGDYGPQKLFVLKKK